MKTYLKKEVFHHYFRLSCFEKYPHIKAGQHNPVGRKGSYEQTKDLEPVSSSTGSHNTNLYNQSTYAKKLIQTHAGPMIVASVSMNFYEPCLVDFVGYVFSGFLNPSGSFNSSSSSSVGFPELCLMFGCSSLHLFPWVTGGSLSDNNQIRHQSISITEYH